MERYKTKFNEYTDEQKWYRLFEDFIAHTRSLLQLNDKDEAVVAIVAECIHEYGGSHNANNLFKDALEIFKSNMEINTKA